MDLIWNASDGRGGVDARPIAGRVEARISVKALARAKAWRTQLSAHDEADAGWNWAKFLKDFNAGQAEGLGEYVPFTLWALDDLQALMIVDVSGLRHRTRKKGLPQVYVEYLAVAPDNRGHIRRPRLVIGCGSAMLWAARSLSEQSGWEGRIGLHSLPGALGFYGSNGFRDLGPDPAEGGFHYMEFSAKVKR